MSILINFPSGDVIKKVEYHLHEKLGVEGSPNLTIVPCDKFLLPSLDNIFAFMVGILSINNEGKFYADPIAFFIKRELAETYAIRVSENYNLNPSENLLKELRENDSKNFIF